MKHFDSVPPQHVNTRIRRRRFLAYGAGALSAGTVFPAVLAAKEKSGCRPRSDYDHRHRSA